LAMGLTHELGAEQGDAEGHFVEEVLFRWFRR